MRAKGTAAAADEAHTRIEEGQQRVWVQHASCDGGVARVRLECADTAGRVGHRLRVWWPDDGAFFSAIIIAHAPARLKQCHFVRYDDGFSEWLDVSEPQLRVQWIDSGNGAAQAKRASARLSGPGGKDAAPSDWGQPAALIPALRRRSMHKST